MIVCRLELWPAGMDDPSEIVHLGMIAISNDGWESARTEGRRGNYTALIFKKNRKRVWKTIKVKSFPRLSYHPWNLIREILNQAAIKNGGRI